MTEDIKTTAPEEAGKNFILNFIDEDIAEGGQFQGMTVHTRFPPEPNGYLHIGHCKALTIDFGTAEKYNGLCNLRMDDTNPTKEDEEFVEAIKQDIQWLGYQWGNVYYASDYFQQLWDFAIRLIKEGKAYIDEQSAEQIAQQKTENEEMQRILSGDADQITEWVARDSYNYAAPNERIFVDVTGN